VRKIKFRAWDKKSKKMRAINSIAFHGLGSFDIPTQDIKLINLWGYNIIEEKHIIVQRESRQVELLQFTGLKDNNGTEIYEGDILNGGFLIDQHIHDCIGLLVFKNYGFIVEVPGFGDEDLFDWKDAETLEVIGNIYEHKHLLEVD